MLLELRIENFAVIDALRLEFDRGLTVFTGETGAGKSILIEALGFLTGGRGSTEWLRSGANKLSVSGVFEGKCLPEKFGGGAQAPAAFELRRELDAGGRTRATFGGEPIRITDLAELGRSLADFHGQHEHQNLMRADSQLEYLDAYGATAPEAEAVRRTHEAWTELKSRREALEMDAGERLRRVDMLRFQLAEIAAVDPRQGEEEALAERLPRLKHAGKLRSLAASAYEELYGKEGSVQESLRAAEENLSRMAELDPALKNSAEALKRLAEDACEIADKLSGYRGEAGEAEDLDALIGRQDKLARLKSRYGGTLEAVFAFRDARAGELEALENHATSRGEIDKKLAESESVLREACEALHEARRKAANKLAARVEKELKVLGMPEVKFSIALELDVGQWTEKGGDLVEYLIAPNPGEPPKALRQVASGGELSRVMLGLKTVLSRQDKTGLLVFDEVDTGVGAVVGRAVGAKLAEIAASKQVLCVTHLPQVACCAGRHFEVSKAVSSGRTFARATRLDGEKRVEAIARMLGGKKTTAASLRHAKEMMTSV